MEELIEDYERKIKAVNKLLEEQFDIIAISRLETKRGCYRAFITDLKRALAHRSREAKAALPLQNVIASALPEFSCFLEFMHREADLPEALMETFCNQYSNLHNIIAELKQHLL